ncbi:MAG: type VI secretion system protein [Gemmataceae bacterium]|nr:type VI secretion system protein [Gemmataceae bacterium]
MAFFQAIWNGIIGFFGLILPLGQKAGAAARSSTVRWVLHVVVLLAILVLLFLLNEVLDIQRLIPGPRLLARLWLPILFLLMYALAWLGWWLWQLLTAEEGPSYYPEIDQAWDEAMRVLAQTGLRLTDLPLFLVLGRPEGPWEVEPGERGRKAEEVLFHQSAQLGLAVKQTPPSPFAPIHVYASRDAVYVTCAGASLLGRQAAYLAGEAGAGGNLQEGGGGEGDGDDIFKTNVGPVMDRAKPIMGIVSRMQRGGGGTEEDHRELRRLERKERASTSPMRDTAQIADATARLRHLCRLIVRDRQPYCPINGVMVVVPLAATDGDEEAHEAGEALSRDLQALRAVLRIDCPQFAMLTDLETAPGFREFIAKQEARDRQRRVGQRFPLGTDLRGKPLVESLTTAVQWLCNNVLREWVYRLFRIETPGKEDIGAATATNARLFMLLNELHERGGRLSHVLTRGLLSNGEHAPRFGGCYLSATGVDPAQQAFVAGVFRRLPEAQNLVAWTPEARADDARSHRWANLLYGILAGLGVAVVAIIGLAVFGSRTTPRR